MDRRPLLLPSVAVALGIVAGFQVPGSSGAALVLAVVCSILSGVARSRGLLLVAWWLLAVGFASGAAPPGPGEHPLDPWLTGEPTLLAGTVVGQARGRPDGSWDAMVDLRAPAAGRVRFRAAGGLRPSPGDHLSARARLRAPRGYVTPAQHDRSAAAEHRGYRANAFPVPSAATLIAAGRPTSAHRIRDSARRFLADRLPQPARGLALALVLGDRSDLDPELVDRFRRTGTSHLLAISGLHVGVVALVLGLSTRRLTCRLPPLRARLSPRTAGLVAGLAGALAYGALTGWAVSTRRAAAMAAAVALVLISRRRADPLQLCAVAWCALLLSDPGALWEPATALSFGSVVAIVRLTPPGRRGLVAGLLLTSAAAAVGTLPWSLSLFGQASLTSIPANLVAIPLLGVVLVPLLLAAVSLGIPAPGLGSALLAVAEVVARLGCLLLRWAGDPRWSPQLEGSPSPAVIALALVVLGGALTLPRLGQRWLGAALAVVVTLLPHHPGAPPPGDLTLTALSVGHGDALLLSFPAGSQMLVDAGGSPGDYDIGEAIVVPALRRLGVDQIDVAVVSHLHADHYGGMSAVLRQLDVGELWIPVVPEPGHPALDLLRTATDRGVPIRIVAAGHPPPSTLDGCALEWLHPRPGRPCPGGHGRCRANGHSIVLRVVHEGRAMLLTGDVEVDLELDLLSRGIDLRAEVLKVPHHGSSTSTSPPLLVAVAPRIAVASLDVESRHGFPRPSVTRRIEAAGVPFLATGSDGTVQIATDGEVLRYRTFRLSRGWSEWRSVPAATAARSPPRTR